jgi:hypothetical protein
MSAQTQTGGLSGKQASGGGAKASRKQSARDRSASLAALRAQGGGLAAALPGAGNHAIGELLQAAAGESGGPLEAAVRDPLEEKLGVSLASVRVHSGSNAAAAADSVNARAYTIGTDVYLGTEAAGLGEEARRRLLTHEAIHTAQQGGRPVHLVGSMAVSNPNDSAEREARTLAAGSPALKLRQTMRDSMRVSHVAPHIQRDITGNKKWPQGEFVVDFAKFEGVKAGDSAGEVGTITFKPSATAPESDHINFIQIVREFDTATGKDFDWGTDPRGKVQTKQNTKKNIAGGFFIDHIPTGLAPRTKKADPEVSPIYPFMNQEGQRRGATKKDAVLGDRPNFNAPLKYNFVSVARATDKGPNHGVVYGTVLWGFEVFLDKAGIAKIKNETTTPTFRVVQGETFDAALQKFNEFYKNPGTAGAPTT